MKADNIDSNRIIRVNGVRQGVFQDQDSIDKAFKKLYEYENLGTIEEFKTLKINNVICEKPVDTLLNEIKINKLLSKSKIESLQKENAELKERLENRIEPKFKKGDWVYVIEPSVIDKHCGLSIFKVCLNSVTSDITYDYAFNGEEVTDDEGYTSFEADIGIANECYIYKTKEQAEAKLKELQ